MNEVEQLRADLLQASRVLMGQIEDSNKRIADLVAERDDLSRRLNESNVSGNVLRSAFMHPHVMKAVADVHGGAAAQRMYDASLASASAGWTSPEVAAEMVACLEYAAKVVANDEWNERIHALLKRVRGER